MNTDKYVGLDVHKDTTVVAIAEEGREGECRVYGTISSDLHALERLLAKIGGADVRLHVVYEAGPTGYVVQRRLAQLGIDCLVVAPSRTPQPKGPRQKTDRRDALVARCTGPGSYRHPRARRRGRIDPGPDAGPCGRGARSHPRQAAAEEFPPAPGLPLLGQSQLVGSAPALHLRELVLPLPALKAVLEEYLHHQRLAQVDRLDELIAAQVPQWKMYPAVQALMCLRGVQLNAATVLVAELGDVHRFRHPRHLMAFLGLVPKEHTTGDSRKLGAITKSGNAHARWMMAEVVQHAFLPPKVSSHPALRQQNNPPPTASCRGRCRRACTSAAATCSAAG